MFHTGHDVSTSGLWQNRALLGAKGPHDPLAAGACCYHPVALAPFLQRARFCILARIAFIFWSLTVAGTAGV